MLWHFVSLDFLEKMCWNWINGFGYEKGCSNLPPEIFDMTMRYVKCEFKNTITPIRLEIKMVLCDRLVVWASEWVCARVSSSGTGAQSTTNNSNGDGGYHCFQQPPGAHMQIFVIMPNMDSKHYTFSLTLFGHIKHDYRLQSTTFVFFSAAVFVLFAYPSLLKLNKACV